MTSMKALPKTVGERIIFARKRKGISQENLATKIGTSRRHMIRLEKNQHAPGPEFRERLGEALDENPDFFKADAEDDEEADSSMSLDELLARQIRRIVARELGLARA